ncbi:MAG: PAS domain S-box protein [Burkholderiaceae bacterium]|nr:PAS domain S-box protein [Burkholderiaceae bacterium]
MKPEAPASGAALDAPLARIAHAAHEAIIAIDESQHIVMLNPAAQQMFGCSAADALGSPLSRFIPERYRAAHGENVRAFADSGVPERSMAERATVVGLRANGEEFPAAVTIARIDGTGPFAEGRHFAALLCDLSTEQGLRFEIEALRRSFRTVVEFAPNAVWIAEAERIVFVNRACIALFGADSADQLLGRSIYELLHAPSRDAVRAAVARVLRCGDGGGDGMTLLGERVERLDGTLRDVDIALAALPDHGQTTLQMVISDVTRQRRESLEQEQAREALRKLSQRLVEVREEERRRIARELHDELGQRLTALKMELASLAPKSRRSALRERIGGMLEMLDDTVASLRRISADLRPLMLDDLGLDAAIEWLARDAARRMGIEVTVKLADSVPALDERVSIALYRMVQEALTNIARHAHASDVHIELAQQSGELVLTVCDNGVGFPAGAAAKEGSFGLLGIRERALALGGTLEVDNPPAGGGRLCVRVPLAPPAPDAPPAPPTLPASGPTPEVAP